MRIGRRGFIATLSLVLIGLLVVDAFWFEKYIIDWTEFDVSKGSTSKIKAIQLTDLHLREIRSYHKWIADRIHTEHPDVLFITGDTITRDRNLPLLDEFLGMLDPKVPIVAIIGNKESNDRVDLDKLSGLFEKHQGILLINSNTVLEAKGRRITVIGLDDYVHGNPDIELAAKGIDPTLPLVVLSHCPVYREAIDGYLRENNPREALILSGHTHGGQIAFFGYAPVKPGGSGKYTKGWYPSDVSAMYVSKGIGTTVLPIRFGARAEATIFWL